MPGNPGLKLNLGLAEEMAGPPEHAIPQFQTILRSQPDNIAALTSLGTSALQTNQPRLAIPALQKLIQLQPEDINAKGMRAGAYLTLNRSQEAANPYRKITIRVPPIPKPGTVPAKPTNPQPPAASTN